MTQTASTLMPFFNLIRVSGDDCASFLHNQLSNDINQLPIGQACQATYNSAKGRVIANMLVLKREEDIVLIAAADLCPTLIKKLQIYIMRSKVKLETIPEWSIAITMPETATVIPTEPTHTLQTIQKDNSWFITLIDGSIIQLGKTNQLPPYNELIANAWQTHEINHGQPWISAIVSETCVAQMLNQHKYGAINFKKGCYPGQEIIARAQYRGQVKRGLVELESNNPVTIGDPIYNNSNEEVGLIINQVAQQQTTVALAVIKYADLHSSLHTQATPLLIKQCFFDQNNT